MVTDDRANLMIVTDYNDNLAAAAGLIAALDVEKNDDVIVRVINLKNVNAAELAKQIEPLYQKLTGKQSKELIEVSASDTANSLMVLSSAANFKEIEAICHFAGYDGRAGESHENIRFEKRRRAGRGQTTCRTWARTRTTVRPIATFTSAAARTQKDTKKMSIVADRRRNAILVQAPPAAMEGIAATIAALDEPVADNSLAPKIVPLENVSAGDIEDVLNELFLKKTQQRSYFFFDEDQPRRRWTGTWAASMARCASPARPPPTL